MDIPQMEATATEEMVSGSAATATEIHAADELLIDELLVEEISIDGMCGVY
jgi:mycofactocin precursor